VVCAVDVFVFLWPSVSKMRRWCVDICTLVRTLYSQLSTLSGTLMLEFRLRGWEALSTKYNVEPLDTLASDDIDWRHLCCGDTDGGSNLGKGTCSFRVETYCEATLGIINRVLLIANECTAKLI
jgi:hypothetical protein